MVACAHNNARTGVGNRRGKDFLQHRSQRGEKRSLPDHELGSLKKPRLLHASVVFLQQPARDACLHIGCDMFECEDMNPAMWQHINILKIERVENGMQEDGSAEPYCKACFFVSFGLAPSDSSVRLVPPSKRLQNHMERRCSAAWRIRERFGSIREE